VSQNGGLDQSFNAKDNLIFQGQFHGISKKDAERRASELISLFNLESFAHRLVTTYSGGQRRRVDIVMALMHQPKLLFLDEPTTGLDPQSRAQVWQEVRSLKEQGMTVFLTTHYLEEVDALCDRVAIIDHGVIVAEGTTHDLKKTISGDLIVVGVDNISSAKIHNLVKAESYVREISENKDGLRIYVEHGETALPQLVRLLDKAQLAINNISLSKPSLDDVFLKQTGRSLRENQG
jgi:ABC-2 type transport system ATP-binding protein